MKYLVTKYENYHKSTIDKFDDYDAAKQRVEQLVSQHRAIFGDDNTISRVENSASRYLYRVEISEATAEAGLCIDLFCVERDLNE